MIKSTDYHEMGDLIIKKLEETLPFVCFSYEYDIAFMCLRIRADFFSHGERKGLIYQLGFLRFRSDEYACESVRLFMCQKIMNEFEEKYDRSTESLIFNLEVPK